MTRNGPAKSVESRLRSCEERETNSKKILLGVVGVVVWGDSRERTTFSHDWTRREVRLFAEMKQNGAEQSGPLVIFDKKILDSEFLTKVAF